MHAFDGSDIPQANSLALVRRIVDRVAEGDTSPRRIAERTGVALRQIQYAFQAARILDWLSVDKDAYRVTRLGEELLLLPSGSAAEREFIRRSIADSDVIRSLAPKLFAARPPSMDDLARRVAEQAHLNQTTARRRAQTLFSWRRQLLEPEPVLFAESVRASTPPPPRSMRSSPPSDPEQLSIPLPFRLNEDLARDVLRDNPWWEGRPGLQLPAVRRDFVSQIHRRLQIRLAPIVVVRGPRQVGKTTAQLQVIEDLLRQGVEPRRILRVQCDELPGLGALGEPILRLADWYENAILKCTLNEAARGGAPAYLFFDEVQNLPDWAVQLKHLVDTSTTQVVVTGSSALRIEQGRDSLAGRISTIEVGTLTLREIAKIRFGQELNRVVEDNGLESLTHKAFWQNVREQGSAQAEGRDQVFAAFSERGGYPLVHARPEASWPELADQLNETVIKRVIQHDLRVGDRGRKRDPALLEELFRLACRYAGQAPGIDLFVREAQRALHANAGPQRVRQYLEFLDRTLLLRLIHPLEIRLKRKHGASKLCLADHGLRASWLQEVVPIDPLRLSTATHLADLAGRLAESIAGSYFLTLGGLDVAHFPARPSEPEVDFILTVGTRRIPVEVKYRRRIDPMADTEGLRSFIEHRAYNAPFGLLITLGDAMEAEDPRIVSLPLASLLLMH